MKEMKELRRYIVNRERYLENLCEHCGEPEGVADHLKTLAKRHPFFSQMLQNDISRFADEAERQKEWAYQRELKYKQKMQEERENDRCMDCPWGNGAGGCSIPGYCQEEMEGEKI